jgi:hypothetical protein
MYYLQPDLLSSEWSDCSLDLNSDWQLPRSKGMWLAESCSRQRRITGMTCTPDVADEKLKFPIAQPIVILAMIRRYGKAGSERTFSRHHQNGQTLAG